MKSTDSSNLCSIRAPCPAFSCEAKDTTKPTECPPVACPRLAARANCRVPIAAAGTSSSLFAHGTPTNARDAARVDIVCVWFSFNSVLYRQSTDAAGRCPTKCLCTQTARFVVTSTAAKTVEEIKALVMRANLGATTNIKVRFSSSKDDRSRWSERQQKTSPLVHLGRTAWQQLHGDDQQRSRVERRRRRIDDRRSGVCRRDDEAAGARR